MPKKYTPTATKTAVRAKSKKTKRKSPAFRPSPEPSTQRAQTPAATAPSVAAPTRRAQERFAQKRPTPTFDYSYVMGDLRRIGLITGIIVAIMILLFFLQGRIF